jgi:hypothetical protein
MDSTIDNDGAGQLVLTSQLAKIKIFFRDPDPVRPTGSSHPDAVRFKIPDPVGP